VCRLKNPVGMFRRMEITAVTVINPFELHCICNRLDLPAIETAETAQIPLKKAANIAQIIEQKVPG